MAWNPYSNLNTPAANTFNPYATPANPYVPNPMGYAQPSYVPTMQPGNSATTSSAAPQSPTTPVSVAPNVNGPFVLIPDRGVIKDAQVERNQTVFFMNQNAPEFYAKSADNLGLCNTKYYRFYEFDPDAEAQAAAAQAQSANQQLANANYMTRDEVETLIEGKIEDIKAFFSQAGTSASKSAKPAKTQKEGAE